MAFPSMVCLWGLQENEVCLESLGRQGRPDPKEAQVMKSCDPPAGPRACLQRQRVRLRGAGRWRERWERDRAGGWWETDTRLSYHPRPESLEVAREPAPAPPSPAACWDPGKGPRPQVPSRPPAPPTPRHLKPV